MGIYDQIVGLNPSTASLIDNYITPSLNTQTVGLQVFVRLTSAYAVNSNLSIYATVTTQYATYGPIPNSLSSGSTTTNNKYVYTSGFGDESAISVMINSISPSSDAKYNYVPNNP